MTKALKALFIISDKIRNGLSLGSIPGVLFSHGPTWSEMRRTSLHSLKDLGFGKNSLEDIVEEEINNLLEHIDNHYLNQPIDVISFFHVSVLASLWRIISGEHLKMGDAKLENLLHMVQAIIKEVGNPMAVVSLRYIWLFQLGNSLGILQTIPYMKEVLNFAAKEMTDHKKRHIDGNYLLDFVFHIHF